MKVTHIYYQMPFVVLMGLMAGRWSQVCQSSDFLHKEMMLLLMSETTLSAFTANSTQWALLCFTNTPEWFGGAGVVTGLGLQSDTKHGLRHHHGCTVPASLPLSHTGSHFPCKNPRPRALQAPQITPCEWHS